MRFQILILTISMFSATAAFAADCDIHQDPISALGGLISPANVTSDDDGFGNADGRGTIAERREDLQITAADELQIRRSSGYIICDGKPYGNPGTASGALVGSNMQIVTSVHTFIDELGRPRGTCSFRNQESPPQIIRIDFNAPYKFGRTGPVHADDPNDFAVARLIEPVKDATPFRVDQTLVDEANPWVIGIAASQKSPTREFPRFEPIVQRCKVRETETFPNAPIQYITDCDLSPLGSGGIVFARNASGAMVVKGIFTATGDVGLNGQPYNKANGSYTRVVGVNGIFGESITEIRNTIPVQTANLKD